MIIVKIMGGLGNQMFQYAAGKRLASHLGTALKLDISSFETDWLRKFVLGNYSISAQIALDSEVRQFRGRPLRGPLRRFESIRGTMRRVSGAPRFYRERSFEFDSQVLHLVGDVYLEGYWQSDKYFMDIAEVIRSEFVPHNGLSNAANKVLEEIKATNSVSLHVRRGDYATDAKTNRIYGLCGLDYYDRCLTHLSNIFRDLHLFLFTDDVTWVKENVKYPHPTTYVSDVESVSDYEELYLMSRCKHHIIANSSFSWWGAWLNSNQGNEIYAPKNWFADSTLGNTCDLIPSSWNVM